MHKVKYDIIGSDYNSTRQADPYLKNKLIHFLRPKLENRYLDLGCGTGNYTQAISNLGFEFYGVDPSEHMLQKAKSGNNKIKWVLGNAEKLPFESNFFDGIIATLTIHHWTNIVAAFCELDRVLKKNGRIVLFTSTPEQMKNYWLNHYFPKMMLESIHQMPKLEVIKSALQNTTLEISQVENYSVHDDLQDHFLYVGKNKPSLYFNENVRNGISSFSSLSNIDEVALGLEKLKNDLNNETFLSIHKSYSNDLGDYTFIIITKS